MLLDMKKEEMLVLILVFVKMIVSLHIYRGKYCESLKGDMGKL